MCHEGSTKKGCRDPRYLDQFMLWTCLWICPLWGDCKSGSPGPLPFGAEDQLVNAHGVVVEALCACCLGPQKWGPPAPNGLSVGSPPLKP